MVLTAYFALSPVIGFLVTVASRNFPRSLTPASRRQDHTTSPSAVGAIRLWCHRIHRIPCPTFVTIAKRPFVWAGMAKDMQVICLKSESEYFCEGGWTASRGFARR